METAARGPFPDILHAYNMEGVLALSESSEILWANRVAEALLGYEAGTLTNTHLADIWSGNYPISRAVAGRSRPPEGGELRRRDGEPLPVVFSVSPPGDASNGSRLLSFTSRAELERLNEALLNAQRLAGIGTMTASVAHELTNPISIINASCTNLLDELQEGPVERESLLRYIHLIEQSAHRCAHTIEALRNYAFNVGAQGDGLIAITSPEAIIRDTLAMVEQQFRKRARSLIETAIQPGLTTLFCDHHRLTQVLIILLTNARDALQPNGGTIRVQFWVPDLAAEQDMAERARSLGLPDDADLFAFSVADTGTGIAPAVMEHLFEPFFTTKSNGQGTGLGLFIARGIVEQHGGCIWAENNPDGGATLTVLLPRRL